jgi:hypothetical protein
MPQDLMDLLAYLDRVSRSHKWTGWHDLRRWVSFFRVGNDFGLPYLDEDNSGNDDDENCHSKGNHNGEKRGIAFSFFRRGIAVG